MTDISVSALRSASFRWAVSCAQVEGVAWGSFPRQEPEVFIARLTFCRECKGRYERGHKCQTQTRPSTRTSLLSRYRVSRESARRSCWEQEDQEAQDLIRRISKPCPKCNVPTEKSGESVTCQQRKAAVVTTCPARDVNLTGAGFAAFSGTPSVKATIGSFKNATDGDKLVPIQWAGRGFRDDGILAALFNNKMHSPIMYYRLHSMDNY
ncbi:predicted protein [Nematostella vectensis]|uniref:Uncharacterized protein n=1 Tax=Nematostella vectensis TaxID=45351 RepID=A7S5G9_NEMVE|nr:predicted protein [Nematostella vectensis]|eukprot:XP_001633186.1 predicted protein [Nematostella vectensis]